MLLDQKITVHIVGRNLKYYNNLGYTCKVNDYIEVDVKDLPKKSHTKVKVKCDYCGEVFEKAYYHYNAERSIIEKDSCEKCFQQKKIEAFQKKYGVDVPLQLDQFKQKVKNTCEQKYGQGITNPMQSKKVQEKLREIFLEKYDCSSVGENQEFREKQKQSMIEKYGVENVFCRGPMREEMYKKIIASRQNNEVFASKNQLLIWKLYRGELNYPYFSFNLDIYFPEEKIYCEYDGSGHQLGVDLGYETQEEFNTKQRKRYFMLKRQGLKIFRIITLNKRTKLPSDDVLLQLKEIAFDFLKNTKEDYIIFDVDNSLIKTHNISIPCEYNNIITKETILQII